MYFLKSYWFVAECQCSKEGSVGAECDIEGNCTCKDHVEGDKCSACEETYYNFPDCLGMIFRKVEMYVTKSHLLFQSANVIPMDRSIWFVPTMATAHAKMSSLEGIVMLQLVGRGNNIPFPWSFLSSCHTLYFPIAKKIYIWWKNTPKSWRNWIT